MKIYMVSLFHRATINKGSISKYGIPKIKKLVPCGTDGRLLLSGFQVVVTFTLTLYRVIQHTVVHQSSTAIYTSNFIEIGKKLFVDTYLMTDGHFPSHVIRPIQSRHKNASRFWGAKIG